MGKPLNDDPFAVWNDPIYQDDPFAPHNDPVREDDPTEPWNNIFGSHDDLQDSDRRYYGLPARYEYPEYDDYEGEE